MASYKDALKLIREGKTPAEIRDTLSVSPYHLKRLLCCPRLAEELENDRHLSVRLARHRLAVAVDRLIERRLEIVESDDDEQAAKATEKLLEVYSGTGKGKVAAKEAEKAAAHEMDREEKREFLAKLCSSNVVRWDLTMMNRTTGKYFFEEAIERGRGSWPPGEDPRQQPADRPANQTAVDRNKAGELKNDDIRTA